MGRSMQRVAIRRDAQLLHVRMSPKAHHELRKLSTRLSKPGSFVKMNDLAIEALELLFEKHGLHGPVRMPTSADR